MNSIKVSAPCKVNLYLAVTGLRADGYHGIESVMTTVPLCDTVTVEKTARGVSVSLTGDVLPDLEMIDERDNIAYRAAELFFKISGADGGASVTIDKKIPSRAGLGGGSADAAATLRALNDLYCRPVTDDELCRASVALGADVPFCFAGGSALCRGIGEIMTKIDSRIELHGVITSEKAEKKSTAEAYRAVDCAMCSLAAPRERSAVAAASAMERGDFAALCRNVYNVFGEASLYPDGARRALTELGASAVVMSGAGPSVVALTENEDETARLEAALISAGYPCYVF